MKFFSDLWSHCVRPHPLMFVLFLFLVVVLLGGLVWWAIRGIFRLVRKVPGAKGVADAGERAIDKAATVTGSA